MAQIFITYYSSQDVWDVRVTNALIPLYRSKTVLCSRMTITYSWTFLLVYVLAI